MRKIGALSLFLTLFLLISSYSAYAQEYLAYHIYEGIPDSKWQIPLLHIGYDQYNKEFITLIKFEQSYISFTKAALLLTLYQSTNNIDLNVDVVAITNWPSELSYNNQPVYSNRLTSFTITPSKRSYTIDIPLTSNNIKGFALKARNRLAGNEKIITIEDLETESQETGISECEQRAIETNEQYMCRKVSEGGCLETEYKYPQYYCNLNILDFLFSRKICCKAIALAVETIPAITTTTTTVAIARPARGAITTTTAPIIQITTSDIDPGTCICDDRNNPILPHFCNSAYGFEPYCFVSAEGSDCECRATGQMTSTTTTTIPIAKPADLNDCNSCLNSNFYWCTKAGGGVGLENNCINRATAGSGLCEEIGGAVVSNAANCPAAKTASETTEEIYDFDYVPKLIRSERVASPKTRAKPKSCDDGRDVVYGTTNRDDISEAKYCLLPRTRENYYQIIEAAHPSFNREIANINKNDISEIRLVVTGAEGIDWPLKRTYSLNEANNWEIVVEYDHANSIFHKLSELAAHNTFLKYKDDYFAKAGACREFEIISGQYGVGTRDNYFGIKVNWNSDGTIANFETGICDGTESYGWAAFDVYAMKIEKKLTGYIRTTSDGIRVFEYANPLDALDQRCVSCINERKAWCYKGTYHNTCTDNSEFNNCNSNCLAICNADNPSSDCEGDCSNECQEKDFYINCGASGGRIISDANSCPYPQREPDVWFYLCDDSYQDCSYEFDAVFDKSKNINLLIEINDLKSEKQNNRYFVDYKIERYIIDPNGNIIDSLNNVLYEGQEEVEYLGYNYQTKLKNSLVITQDDLVGVYSYVIIAEDKNTGLMVKKTLLFEVR